MKILLFNKGRRFVSKSGVGAAISHQEKIFTLSHIEYTEKLSDEYDIVQINTVFPSAWFMAKYAKKSGKKVVYYAHSTMENFKYSFVGSNIFAPLFKK